MHNLDHWNMLARPPAYALKQITAGRLRGKSDISPMWRMQAMTEVYGPYGSGWWYTVDETWITQVQTGEEIAHARVTVTTCDEPERGATGLGASFLVAREKEGFRANKEAYKMAITDALGCAMKAYGVAAEIYLGQWEGDGYRDHGPAAGPDPAITKAFKDRCDKIRSMSDEVKAIAREKIAGLDREAAIAAMDEIIEKNKSEADE